MKVFLLVFILFASQVLALGISPAAKHIEFQPNYQESIQITLFNNEGNGQAKLSASGPLAEYITFSENNFQFNEERKTISYTISLPSSLPPGTQTTQIKLELEGIENEGISGVPSVLHTLTVGVPLPGVYCESKITESENQLFTTFFNFGTQETFLTFQSNFNEEKNYEEITIQPRTEHVFITPKPQGLGEYFFSYTAFCDQQKIEQNKTIINGEPSLQVRELLEPVYQAGKINPVLLTIDANWNKPIEVQWKVITKQNNIINEQPMPSFTLEKQTAVTANVLLQDEGNYEITYDFSIPSDYTHSIATVKIIQPTPSFQALYTVLTLLIILTIFILATKLSTAH